MVQLYKSGNFNADEFVETKYVSMNVNWTDWEDGQTGSVGSFSQNGSTSENYRVLANDPWGKETVVWEARADAVSGADGGWNHSTMAVDNTKFYRLSVWVKRTVRGTSGRFYFGTRGYGVTEGLYYRDTGALNTNPYFYVSATPPTNLDDWTLAVGHIWPVGSGTGDEHPDSGLYNIDGRVGNISRDFVFHADTTTARHRTYLYYSTDTSTRQIWCYPRMEVCDGFEPSIADLLAGLESRNEDYYRAAGGDIAQPMSVYANQVRVTMMDETQTLTKQMQLYPKACYVQGIFNEVDADDSGGFTRIDLFHPL
jgi:hypothetical protein